MTSAMGHCCLALCGLWTWTGAHVSLQGQNGPAASSWFGSNKVAGTGTPELWTQELGVRQLATARGRHACLHEVGFCWHHPEAMHA